LAVKELTQKMSEQFKKDRSSSHTPVKVSAIKSQPFSVPGRGFWWHTPRATLRFHLCDQGEDMRNWDVERTWRLEAQVQEVQEKKLSQMAYIQENYCSSVCWAE